MHCSNSLRLRAFGGSERTVSLNRVAEPP
jgi:hypothetical protein